VTPQTTALESLLRRPALAVLAGIAGTAALCWAYLVPAALDMYGAMDGLSAWMMQRHWDGRYFVLIFLMWAVMMTGMMLPSAAPTILLYGAIVRSRPQPGRPVARSYAFAGGYLLAWAGFSALATLSQWRLAEAALISPMMESRSPVLGGGLLIFAGVYQWTPLKQACLHQCRSPVNYLSQHWRAGVGGALRMGVGHGLFCLGCCWALMLLLFFGGVMNLLWIAGITLFVLLEKLAPFGAWGGRVAGLLLAIAGGWLLVHVA
jgi:predicted metal-binding membrane protein